MAFMTWDDKYSLKMKEVDEQHQHLFELINRLHEAVVTGEERTTLAEILDELIDYTVEHFQTEEKLFEEHNYPEYDMHKKEHDDLTKKVLELQTQFGEGSATISFEVLDFLNDWLLNHTLHSDQKYSLYLHDKGVV
jgi:hemerythrin